MLILEQEDQDLHDRVQAQNLLRQYDLMTNCIEIGLKQGPLAFDKYLLWSLNHVAVANISQFGGRFREEPIYVGDHRPPHFRDVSDWMDRFITTVQENWYIWTSTELAAYGLWRLNVSGATAPPRQGFKLVLRRSRASARRCATLATG